MGNSCGGASGDDAKKKDRELQKLLAQQNEKENAKIKLLLLGAGESGKSTIFKQMKILYGKEATEEELMESKPVVQSNVMVSMRTILKEGANLGLRDKINCQDALDRFEMIPQEDETLSPDKGRLVKELWEDAGVQEIWDRRAEYQITDSSAVFFADIDHIAAKGYIPTERDILLSRVRTSGIVTEQYVIDDNVFEMYDVGGQRNERKKWIHCFDNVTAVIFVAAISEYNQKLFEDSSTNRMLEALDLFEEIAKSSYFLKSSMMLFLNKRDLFAEKIATIPINDTPEFSDYAGGANYDAGCHYFLEKFKDRFNTNSEERELYHHITCATDTKNVQVVFGACKDIILKNNLKDSGFL